MKRVNKTCSDNAIFTEVEVFDRQTDQCFGTCSDSGTGLARNTSSACWISCFYETVLGPDSGEPLRQTASPSPAPPTPPAVPSPSPVPARTFTYAPIHRQTRWESGRYATVRASYGVGQALPLRGPGRLPLAARRACHRPHKPCPLRQLELPSPLRGDRS